MANENVVQKPVSIGKPAWLDRIKYTTKDKGDPHIRVLLYGEMGSGKTTAAATFPHPFIINTDKGLKTLQGRDIPYIDIVREEKVYQTILQILLALRKDRNALGFPVETIVIDGFTSLGELLLDEIVRENRSIANWADSSGKDKALFDDYGMLRQRIWSIVTLLQDIPYHVVGTAWTTIEKDEITGRIIGRPDLVGKMRESLGGYFDEYYYMVCRQGRTGEPAYVYEAYTKPYQFYQARTRLAKLPPIIQNLTYDKIVQLEGIA